MANNTHIKVYWDDILDNYSQAKEREIARYFEKKYGGTANVVFRAIRNASTADMKGLEADATDQVLDVDYQRKLTKKYLADNNINIDWHYFTRLDDNINTKLAASREMSSRYKKFFVKKIYLNNFLSYADKEQVMPLEDLQGISVITSQPTNFAGKTISIVDALLFLFFGNTTKSETLEDVFNKYTTSDTVVVRGELEVDGEQLLIERTVTRTLKRDKSGYTTKSSVEFREVLPDGTFGENYKGERRQKTDKKVTEYIGNYEDFLLTVITTIRNFYSLADSKPTERGKIFTRFIGVEVLSEKADMCKSMYSDWFKSTKLSTYTSATLDDNIFAEQTKASGFYTLANGVKTQLVEMENKIVQQDKDIEIQTLKKHQNVDEELYKIREEDIVTKITQADDLIASKESSINQLRVNLVKPEKVFDIDIYNELKGQIQENNDLLAESRTKKSIAESAMKQFKDGENCPWCKRPLEGVDHSAEIAEQQKLIDLHSQKMTEVSELLVGLNTQLSEHESIKEAQTAYEKAELIIQRNQLELDNLKTSLQVITDTLARYRSNKTFIEENRQIDTQIQKLKFQLQEMKNERETNLLTLKGYEKDIESSNILIERYKTLKAEVLKEEIIQKIYMVYMEVFGKNGISKMILGTMVPILNSYLSQMMFETVPFRLEIRLNDKNEVEFWMIDMEGDVEKMLKSGSGYESTICLLALRCVLSKVCSLPKPNIVVFDEVFGQVSDENMPLLGAFFERMKEYFDNIFIITHNPVMLDWANHVIHIKKENNISYILTNVQKK
jgi:DNA repair exonuclease SbcCD ATPase subunit